MKRCGTRVLSDVTTLQKLCVTSYDFSIESLDDDVGWRWFAIRTVGRETCFGELFLTIGEFSVLRVSQLTESENRRLHFLVLGRLDHNNWNSLNWKE